MLHPFHKVFYVKKKKKRIVYGLHTTVLINQKGNIGHGILECGHGRVVVCNQGLHELTTSFA